MSEPITMRKGFTGTKPPRVCSWILDMLGFRAGDELDDLYPGTGVMGRVIADWGVASQGALIMDATDPSVLDTRDRDADLVPPDDTSDPPPEGI